MKKHNKASNFARKKTCAGRSKAEPVILVIMPKIILIYFLIFVTGSFYLDSAYAKGSHESCHGREIYATEAFAIKVARDKVSDDEITRMANEGNIHAML